MVMSIVTILSGIVMLGVSAAGIFGFGMVSYGIMKGYDK